jgi:cytochrome c oxidase subunit 2
MYIFLLLIGVLIIFDFVLERFSSDKNITAIEISKKYTSSLDILFVLTITLYIISMMLTSIGYVFSFGDNLNGQEDIYDLRLYLVASQWYWNVFTNVEYFDPYTLTSIKKEINNIEFYSSDDNDRRWLSNLVIVLPSNVSITFGGTSADVIHSLGIPSAGFKFDCVPGRLQSFTTLFTEEGFFEGHCYEICGAEHAYMSLGFQIVTFEEFCILISLSAKESEFPNVDLDAEVSSADHEFNVSGNTKEELTAAYEKKMLAITQSESISTKSNKTTDFIVSEESYGESNTNVNNQS